MTAEWRVVHCAEALALDVRGRAVLVPLISLPQASLRPTTANIFATATQTSGFAVCRSAPAISSSLRSAVSRPAATPRATPHPGTRIKVTRAVRDEAASQVGGAASPDAMISRLLATPPKLCECAAVAHCRNDDVGGTTWRAVSGRGRRRQPKIYSAPSALDDPSTRFVEGSG